jgi:RNA polymerase sigma-70 factor (ECF subfamily)
MTDKAFEVLFRQHQGMVYGWIVRIVRDPAAAEDLTIETFWRVYRARGRFDPSREFAPWARRIASNCALNYLRRPRPLPLTTEGAWTPEVRDPAVRDGIARAFASLPARLRIAATLAFIEELPYDEIASALDISVAAVKSRVFRATRKLRTKLERMGITV